MAIGTRHPRVSRDGQVPLHHQIAAWLRQQIASGALRPGMLVPSEHQLTARFGVSRGTVRQALAALRSEGLISVSRGRPPVVCHPPLTQPFSELLSFSAWIQSLGKIPSGRVVEFGPRPVEGDVAASLGLQPGDIAYHLVRLRLADEEPLMVERTTFPAWVGELVATLDLDHQSIYAELGQRGVLFASARHLIDAVPASALDARLLRVRRRTPLLRVRRLAFSPLGKPLEWSDDRYLAERVSFAIDNSSQESAIVRRLEGVAASGQAALHGLQVEPLENRAVGQETTGGA